MIKTRGFIEIKINDKKTKFHIVDKTFNIQSCGILGLQFLKENSAIMFFNNENVILNIKEINHIKNQLITLPARSRKIITLNTNSNLKEGFLERIDAGNGIFLGNSLVGCENGKIKVFAINSTLRDVELTLPPVEIQEFEVLNPDEPKGKISHNLEQSSTLNTRLSKILEVLDLSCLNDEEKSSLIEVISKYPHRFKIEGDILGTTNVVMHEIRTADENPTFQRQYRIAEIHSEEILNQTNELIKTNFIEESDSPYNSPIWIVPKKPDAQGNKRWRMVIDFRQLNKKTISDAYPLPNITHILDQLGGAQYFSTLDLAMGFHQVPMHPNSKSKTAFSTPYGHFQFKRMPFGLKNAPATFQRLMNKVLSGLQGHEILVYMDDIVIYARSLQEHTKKLTILLERLETANLTLEPSKCMFLRKEVGYLGHIISNEGVKPDPKKIEAVRKFPRPKTIKNIKEFLGLAGYYRRFIQNFSTIAKPLSYLLKKNVRFSWTNIQQTAFDKLKNTLCTYPLLQYPNFAKPFTVSTDASNYGIGGVLSQYTSGKDLPVAYASRTLSDTETNYSTIEKELLAILFCVETFRPYLYGRKFTLETDHRPLVWLHNVKNPGSKLTRWRFRLSEYDYDIVYKKGSINSNADALSRNPLQEMETNLDIDNEDLPSDELDPLDPSFLNSHEVTTPVTPTNQNTRSNSEEMDKNIEFTFFDYEYDEPSCETSQTEFCYVCKFDMDSNDSDEVYDTADEDEEICTTDGRSLTGSIVDDNDCVAKPFGLAAIPSSETRNINSEGSSRIALFRPTGESQIDNVLLTKLTSHGAILGSELPCAVSESSTRTALPMFVDKVTDYEVGEVTELEHRNSIDKIQLNDYHKTDIIEESDSDLDSEFSINEFTVIPKLIDSFVINSEKIGPLTQSKQNSSCYPISQTDSPLQEEFQISQNENEIFHTNEDNQINKFDSTFIQHSKDKLYMRNDHLGLFISADCVLTTETARELIQMKRINYDHLKIENFQNLQVGNVIVHKYENFYTFYLIIKENFDSKIYTTDLLKTLTGLKYAMDALEVTHISISRIGNGLNQISFPFIEKELKKIFVDRSYIITVCYGEIETPSDNDRSEIIKEYHSSTVGGHKGSNKTYNRIRENFYWPNMREEIRDFVRNCGKCKENKLVRIKTKLPMRITDTPSEAFEKIEIDIVGPLPETGNKNKYILTIQCNLTKYSDAIPLPDTQSTTIATALAENFISRFGCPQIIHTDQGSNFTSRIMSTFCKIFKVKQIQSTAFHPQSLGSLERSHHVLIQYLKIYCQKSNWDRWLRFAIFSYNTSTHESTGFTPHELIFGKKANIPSEFSKQQIPLTYNLFLKTLYDKIVETQSQAKTRLESAKEKAKKYYDQKLNTQQYSLNDMVYLLNQKSSKLDKEYLGPYKVVSILNDFNVEIDLGKGKTKIVHMNRLRPQALQIFPD